jgi:GT2 family glycosyltransferase
MERLQSKPVSILAVVVLYQMKPTDSLTLKTLRASIEALPSDTVRFKTLIYDNTASPRESSFSLADSVYIAPGVNRGISEAYNQALDLAIEEHFDWILTLDQDTELPSDFVSQIASIAQTVDHDTQVASILPLIMQGQQVLSPHWFKFDFFPYAFSNENHALQHESVYGFNSAALLRVSALKQVGGYNPLFWLDYSDAYIFRKLHLAGYKGFVAGKIVVQHHLSILNISGMSDARFRNITDAGSAFCDMFRNRLVGLEFTYRLIRSYCGQLLHHGSNSKKNILRTAILRRLLQSKSKRINDWTQQETTRRDLSLPPAQEATTISHNL